ncbi:ribose transport system ATP-binding protein [Fictibacillus enclensis]|uniref:D-ribose transporter ATP-binding protein n=1 Tax=Fictibacillus enclensis TaxID=1017270 RepID=A0A0V8J4C7_9BACL|nr:sugar ABC transporter ATP-binding protein [Fictibacillus enclensis]KSU82018.1 D-ribose transporter ATP-binding protein [Fictibacillus enclensis]SCC29090.1 ribose transport system ATP-binding protein [Fictibacillus enclensis]
MNETPLVQLSGIYKSFSDVHVLKDVNFEVRPGEVHALMGENGAGKSTLMKIMAGIYQRDKGTAMVKGKEVHFSSPKEAEEMGIGVVHQELNIIPYLTVTENLFLGKELTYGKSGILRTGAMRKQARKALEALGVKIDPDAVAGELSVGQQQMIEIAKVLETNSDCIIMDEPTAALTDREIEALFEVIEKLRNQGVGIVYISHRMEEIFRICDRISVLRDGNFIGTKMVSETDFDEIVSMMVGRELGDRFPVRQVTIGPERLRVENLSRNEHFKDIHFDVKQGEILGVAGLMGAGRTEIMEAIFGYKKKDSGTVYLDGQRLNISKPADAIAAGLAFVTEDRKDKGLVIGMTVRENFTLTNLKAVSKNGILSARSEQEETDRLIKKLHVKTSGREQTVKSLSGGNQQKIVIGKWVNNQPKVLILDEPTRGVDVGAKKEIYQIMNELTEQGVSIIMVSSELPEILGMSDRILVIHEGKIAKILHRQEADQEKIMHAATGGM